MSSFSRSALEMLQAAEDSLTQRRYHGRGVSLGEGTCAHKKIAHTWSNDCAMYPCGSGPKGDALSAAASVEELQQQLGRAMRELIELRAELASERDRRHETLIAMGRQWKEDVLVEVHRREAALQSDFSSIEEKMAAQWKESNEGRLIIRRQLEEVMRASRVRDTDRFQLREELQEMTHQMEERVDAALVQSSAARADCSRQLEQERATLSQRLDAELLRLVEMRRDDQRALQQAKELMRNESLRMKEEMRKAVQEVWEGSATALLKTVTEPVEQLRAELRQTKANTQAMEERVADCLRTCQTECRVVTQATKEQLHALESKEAVSASSIDRAERKADTAYETALRMETAIAAAKEATERALTQVAGAVERTQRIEHTFTDRDSRLVAVESQLHAIATAEGLKAEVEACKRQAARLESRLEASGAMCARVDQLADRTAQQVTVFADRIGSCEGAMQRGVDAVQRVQEGFTAYEAESQQVRNRFETMETVHQRHTHLITQLEQRVTGQEGRLELWRQQQEHHVRDHIVVQRELTDRIEVAHTVASRAEQVSSDVRGEVNRLGHRLDGIDNSLSSTSAEINALRGAVEDQRVQLVELQRYQKQVTADVRLLSSRVNEQTTTSKGFERHSVERVEAHVQHLAKSVAQCEERLSEMDSRVQDYLGNAARQNASEIQKRLHAVVNENIGQVTERVAAVEGTAEQLQRRFADIPQQLAAMQQSWVKLQRHVDSLGANLQALRGQTDVLAVNVDTQGGDRQRLCTMQQELMRLTAMQGRAQQDVILLQEAIRGLQVQVMVTAVKDRSFSGLAVSPAHTATTEMAAATEANSSSPSIHQPSGAGLRASPGLLVAGTLPEQQQPRLPAAAAPPLTEKYPVVPPGMTSSQRASSGSSDRKSKESSGERPALHLSGVSSVRPPDEQEGRLNSLAEHTERSNVSSGGDDVVENFAARPLEVDNPPRTSSETRGWESAPQFPTAAPNRKQHLSALAITPGNATATVNVSQRTAIREFTAIASTSSLTDDESSEDGETRRRGRVLPEVCASFPDEVAEDISADSTDTVTLTSEVPGSQSSQLHSRPPTSPDPAPVVALAGAWGHSSHGSTVEKIPAARQETRGNVSPPRVKRFPIAGEYDQESGPQMGETKDNYNERVQVMLRRDSDTAEVGRTATAEKVCADVTELEPSHTSQLAATSASLPHTRISNWNDWDSNREDSHTEGERETPEEGVTLEPQSSEAPAAQFEVNGSNESSTGDAVMQLNDLESSSTPVSRRLSSDSPATGLASTLAHHQSNVEHDLAATPRRIFVSTSTGDRGVAALQQGAQVRDTVPRHGMGTTSSSSSSAERAEALGLRGVHQSVPQRLPTQMRQYTNFDDSTSSDN